MITTSCMCRSVSSPQKVGCHTKTQSKGCPNSKHPLQRHAPCPRLPHHITIQLSAIQNQWFKAHTKSAQYTDSKLTPKVLDAYPFREEGSPTFHTESGVCCKCALTTQSLLFSAHPVDETAAMSGDRCSDIEFGHRKTITRVEKLALDDKPSVLSVNSQA